MRNLTRITIAVSRGLVTYTRGGTPHSLSANGVLQEDTSGRFFVAYLMPPDVRKLLGWWESGTVNTPDIESLPVAGSANNNAGNAGNNGNQQNQQSTPAEPPPAPPEGKPAPAKDNNGDYGNGNTNDNAPVEKAPQKGKGSVSPKGG